MMEDESLSLAVTGRTPREIARELYHAATGEMGRRRAIVGLSFFSMAALAPVCLLQMGMTEHLPDPPSDSFHADETNRSDAAFVFGIPDGPLAVASLALNLPLASFGGRDRVRRHPWAPLLAVAKAGVDVAINTAYFSRMARRKEPWGAYGVSATVGIFGILGLMLPEAGRAVRKLLTR